MSGSLGVYLNNQVSYVPSFYNKSLWLHVPWADSFIHDYVYPKFW